MVSNLDTSLVQRIKDTAMSSRYADRLRTLVTELVGLNTVANNDLGGTAARERQLLDYIAGQVKATAGPQVRAEFVPINAAIANDADYSPPAYAANARGEIPPADQVYANRGNLVVTALADAPPGVILNAHIDVVAPWFNAQATDQRVSGRGASDNKAQVALLLAQMELIQEIETQLGRKTSRGRVYQFVIDEEIGGNGSLSLAMDPRWAGLPVIVHECTGGVPYCAHRGAVDYRCRLSTRHLQKTGAAELFPIVVMALESEGRKIREESRHALFKTEDAQTNHGRVGPFGHGPGGVCDHLAVEIDAKAKAKPDRIAMRLTQFMEEALAKYTDRYGDKTREIDPVTREPLLAKHFEVSFTPMEEAHRLRVDVWGRAGHMAVPGSADNAITKAACLFMVLLKAAASYPTVEAFARLAGDQGDGLEIELQGCQGFTPAHKMSDVQQRMTAAALKAVKQYCYLRGRKFDANMIRMSFDRLHNDAYAASPEMAPMQALKTAFAALGEPWPEPRGWNTSCDARIFHKKGHPTAIFGAGELNCAHGSNEHIEIARLQRALALSTLAVWTLTE